MTYYERLKDGTIGVSTESSEIAKDLGLTLTTDREIVYGYNGKRYFSGDEPPRPVTFTDYDAALEAHLDTERIERGYTKREPTDYANSTNPRWRQDAADWAAHRDAVMEYGLEVENAAKRGESVPTVEDFKAALPRISWTFPALAVAFAFSAVLPAGPELVKMATKAELQAHINDTNNPHKVAAGLDAQTTTNIAVAAANDLRDKLQAGEYQVKSANYADSATTAETANIAETAEVAEFIYGPDYIPRHGPGLVSQLDAATKTNASQTTAIATKVSAAQVTNIVRNLSLGGVWDESLQTWWTPRMRNGSLTYEATTNVNLNAEN